MVAKRAKEFQRFLRTVGSFSDGQVRVLDWDCDHLNSFDIEIRPNDGAYKGGKFHFRITLPRNYPKEAPIVMCRTQIYHPNIDTSGCGAADYNDDNNVCVSLLDEWVESCGLDHCVQALLFLFHNPNLEDPLSPYFSGTAEEEDFEDNVKVSLSGGDVDGYSFPKNSISEDPDVTTGKDIENNLDSILKKVEEMAVTQEDYSLSEEGENCASHPDDKGSEVGENASEAGIADDTSCTVQNIETPSYAVQSDNVTTTNQPAFDSESVIEEGPGITDQAVIIVHTESSMDNLMSTVTNDGDSPAVFVRQNSKIDPQTSNLETDRIIDLPTEGAAVVDDPPAHISSKRQNLDILETYLRHHRTFSFIAPDWNHFLPVLAFTCLRLLRNLLQNH